jgi:sugar lactone lactonase YvrE
MNANAVREYAPARLVLDARASLGECPLWSVAEQALYWVDIAGCAIHRFDPVSGRDAQWPTPCEPGCIAFARGGGLVAALRDGFYRFHPATGALRKIADAPYDTAAMRFNDGRCDAAGRFWAGAMFEARTAESAAMFCLEGGRVREGWGPAAGLGVKVSNGLAFAPDGRSLFQSDTPNHVIYRFDFDPATGAASRRSVFARANDNRADRDYGGRPDGAAVDSQGGYWSAQYEGGRVLRYDATGTVVGIVRVPARRSTMVAFGGPKLSTLYITSAREGAGAAELAEFPHSGGLFACELDVAGRAEPAYAGD